MLPAYKNGDIIAIAQRYEDVYEEILRKKVSLMHARSIVEQREKPGWNNKMFVRADIMPHQIRIASIKVEQLQDISDEDCMKEGVIEYAPCCECGSELYAFDGADDVWHTPREAFAALIDKVSGKGTWEKNPWVFAYSFVLIK